MREVWEPVSTYVHFADAFAFGPDWSLPHRKNPFTALWLMEEGEIELTIGSEVVMAKSGDVLLIPTGTPFHASYFPSCKHHRLIALRFTLRSQEQLDWFTQFRLPYVLPGGATAEAKEQAQQVVQHLNDESSSLNKLKANAVMQLLLADILCKHEGDIRPCAGTHTAQQHVFKLIRWMEDHLSESFELKDLAQKVHISSDYIHELFISVVGVSPMQYARRLRLRKAKQLLCLQELSVRDICELTGFSSPQYFARVFKNAEGMTPTEYMNGSSLL